MARPRGKVGEVRAVIATAMVELGSGGAGVTVRTLAERCQVGYRAAHNTVNNMVRAGQAERVGCEKRAGSLHWEQLYAMKEPEPPSPEAGMETLACVMRGFAACATAEA
jgi:hypothetical protein